MDTSDLVLDGVAGAAVLDFVRDLGFSVCGIVDLDRAPHGPFFRRWLALGRAQEMSYLERFADRREDPRLLGSQQRPLRSMIVVALDYGQVAADLAVLADPGRARIARYAWLPDYHDVLRPLLYEIDGFVRRLSGRSWLGKALVDSGPVLERDWAMQAGVGFTGKNCCTIHPSLGSWLFLASVCVPEVFDSARPVLTAETFPLDDVVMGLPFRVRAPRFELPLISGSARGGCGSCARCLVGCPTDAFVGPYHLDPARCISYWTIESREPIPVELRSAFGNWVFGCDVCQDVCPWNHRRRLFGGSPLGSALLSQVAPPLLEGFDAADPYWLDDAAFLRRFARSPVLRARRAGVLRNVCVALGNWAAPAAIDPLKQALQDQDALPRGHAAWALGQIGPVSGDRSVFAFLQERLLLEDVPWVGEEIASAIARCEELR